MKSSINRTSLLCFAICISCSATAADTNSESGSLSATTGVAYVARYLGSEEYHAVGVLGVNYQSPTGVFFDSGRLGYRTSASERVNIAASIGYDQGRKDQNGRMAGADSLSGMGDIDAATAAFIEFGYQLTEAVNIAAMVIAPISDRQDDIQAVVSFDSTLLTSEKDRLSAVTSLYFGTQQYNQSYFGVTEEQHQHSAFEAFTPKQGLNSVVLQVNWAHQLNKNWSTCLSISTSQLMNDAGSSPITQSRSNNQLAATITYTL